VLVEGSFAIGDNESRLIKQDFDCNCYASSIPKRELPDPAMGERLSNGAFPPILPTGVAPSVTTPPFCEGVANGANFYTLPDTVETYDRAS